jgi:hypothetical protein
MEKKNYNKEKARKYQATYHAKNPGLKAKWNKAWIQNNRERFNAAKYRFRDRVKEEVLLHYGNGKIECNYCGYDNIDALCLDHINNDGAEQRKKMKISGRGTQGSNTYEVLRRLNYPDGIQILCANCNLIKEIQRKREKRLLNKWYKNGISNPT